MKKFLQRLLCILTAAIMIAALCAVPASAASVKLNKTKVNLPTGYSVTLTVKGADNAKWSSSDKSVAYVKSSNGKSAKIVGKKTGTAYIYAKVGSKKLKCKVTVKKSFITANDDTVNLVKGKSQTVTLTVNGAKNVVVSNSDKSVCSTSWGSWNKAKNKITLKITAKKAGTAKIKVYAKGFSKSTAETITVKVSNDSSKSKPQEQETQIVIVDQYGNVYIVDNNDINIDYDNGGSDSNYDTDNSNDNGSDDSASSANETEQVIALVNQERAAAGLDPLESDPTLNSVAALRANEIVEYFSHTRPDGTSFSTALTAAGYTESYVGENIAAGQRSPADVMDSWMSSQGHKANILNGYYNKIGVGFVKVSGGYGYYWVQIFSR